MSVISSILGTKELVTLPAIATNVLRMLENENVELKEIVRIIQTDPSLSVKILKIANSPLYATRREITSIQQAIMLIGFNKLVNIILGVSIFSKFWLSTKQGAEELMNKFWIHSCSTGTIAKFITGKIKKNYNENEFIGGLLHQIGKLAMIQYDLEKYNSVIKLIQDESMTDLDAEKQVFDVTHLEVGSALGKLWKLPDEITQIISYYKFPSNAPQQKELISVVNLAGLICESNGYDFYKGIGEINIVESEAWSVIGELNPFIKEKGIDNVLDGVTEEFSKSSDFLNTIRS